MDSIIKEFREFFLRNVQVNTGSKSDQESNYSIKYQRGSSQVFNRFIKGNYPSEDVFSKWFNSLTFKLNIEDTATQIVQGLVSIATNTEIINKTDIDANGYQLVVKPSQLSIIKPYKSYVVQLTQSGANAPVVVVLEDTIGITNISYINTGIYRINPTNTGSFPVAKTFINGNFCVTGATNDIGKIEFKNEIDDIEIMTYEKSNSLSDDVLTGYMSGDQVYYLEIRVYN